MEIAQRLARIAPSATLAAGEKAGRLRAEGIDVLDLGPGQPDFPTPEHIGAAGRQAITDGHTRYTPAAGIPPLRAAVAEMYQQRYGIDYEPAEAIITVGGKHALYSAFAALVEPGDEVIIPSPYWVSYPDQVRLMDGIPVFVDAAEKDDFVVQPDAVEAACGPRTRALVLNSPCNPTGSIVSGDIQKELARIAIERDIAIIYDECYDRFLYEGKRHASPLDLGPEAKAATIVVGSCSKTYSMTGWRIGWAVGPKQVIGAAARLNSHLTSNPSSVAQQAALTALTGDQSSVDEMLAAFSQRRELVIGRLSSMSGVTCPRPLGAFYAFPNVSQLFTRQVPSSVEMANFLIDEFHVVTVPGIAFGREGYLRLSFAVSLERLRTALDRLEEAFTSLASGGVRRPPNRGTTSDFVDETDVREAVAKGRKITIGPKTVVTPLAREYGESHGVFKKG